MTIILIIRRIKLAWSPAERGVFVLRKCVARKHPKIGWVEWRKIKWLTRFLGGDSLAIRDDDNSKIPSCSRL